MNVMEFKVIPIRLAPCIKTFHKEVALSLHGWYGLFVFSLNINIILLQTTSNLVCSYELIFVLYSDSIYEVVQDTAILHIVHLLLLPFGLSPQFFAPACPTFVPRTGASYSSFFAKQELLD